MRNNKQKFLLLPSILWLGLWLLLPLTLGAISLADLPQNVAALPVGVSVTGMVKHPGTYNLTNLNRISEAIEAANQWDDLKKMAAAPEQHFTKDMLSQSPYLPDAEMSYRNVILRRSGKDTVLDLLSYLKRGDSTQNPYLQDGDVIVIAPLKDRVSISGAVFVPGDYEYRPDDTVGTLIGLALGLKPEADRVQARLIRYGGDQKSLITLSVSGEDLQNPQAGSGTKLLPGDRIFISSIPDYHPNHAVEITGEVMYPGTYAIADSVSLLALRELCGGPTLKADLHNAVVTNAVQADRQGQQRLALQDPELLADNPPELQYLRIKARQLDGRYAVDLQRLWQQQEKAADLYLYPGDKLDVPVISRTITMVGLFKNPGVFAWEPGMTVNDYVVRSGGYCLNADKSKIRIIRQDTGNWEKPTKETKIQIGDMIYVPEKQDKTNWELTKEVILVTSQVITVLIGINSLSK